MANGRYFAISTAQETAYGDSRDLTATSSFNKIRVTGMSDNVNRNVAFEEACDISVATEGVGGTYKVGGTIDSVFRFGGMTPLIRSICGASTSVTNDFTLGDDIKSYGFLIGDDQSNKTILYTGCGVSSMELTFAVKEFVRARMSWVGSKAYVGKITGDVTTWVTAPTADVPAVFYSGVIQSAGTAIKVKNATLRIDRKIDEDYYFIGSPLLQGLYMNGMTELGGSLTVGAGEWDLLQKTMIGDETSTITAPNEGSVATAASESLNELSSTTLKFLLGGKDGDNLGYIECGNIILNDDTHSVQGRNQWEKTVNYRCVLPTSNSFKIHIGA